MRPRPVVVLVGAKNMQQVAPSEDEEVVEALSAKGPHPSLRERVRPRSAHWCLHHGEPLGLEDLVEGTGELGVSIPNEDVRVFKMSGDREVSELAERPTPSRGSS